MSVDETLKIMIEENRVLETTCFPELGVPEGGFHKGKVRDNYEINDIEGIQFTTDRISAGDVELTGAIPLKGALFVEVQEYWAKKIEEEQICQHHLKKRLTTNSMLIEQLHTLGLEVIVRGFITGSAWRDFNQIIDYGKRHSSTNNKFYEQYGIELTPDMFEGGEIKKNAKFVKPIVTITTKADGDPGITVEEAYEFLQKRFNKIVLPLPIVEGEEERSLLLSASISDRNVLDYVIDCSKKLYKLGAEELAKKGKIFVDTKFEWGVRKYTKEQKINYTEPADCVVLADEWFTTDSSRFWELETYQERFEAEEEPQAFDKEYVRKYLQEAGLWKKKGVVLPDSVRLEAAKIICQAHEFLTGADLDDVVEGLKVGDSYFDQSHIVCHNLNCTYSQNDKLIKGYFVSIIAGSGSDIEKEKSPVKNISKTLKALNIPHGINVASAHRDPESLFELVDWFDSYSGDIIYIDVTGMSNGKGPSIAARTLNPVIINYENKSDKDSNEVWSSLQTPSGVAPTVAYGGTNSALAAAKILGLKHDEVKEGVEKYMQGKKAKVAEDNAKHATVYRPK